MLTKTFCPINKDNVCEEAKDGHILRCAWYVDIDMMDEKGNAHLEQHCAITWMPTLQVETARTNRGQTAALESMRNEQVKGHNSFMSLISNNKSLKGNRNGE